MSFRLAVPSSKIDGVVQIAADGRKLDDVRDASLSRRFDNRGFEGGDGCGLVSRAHQEELVDA
jgi:hypothetical protein